MLFLIVALLVASPCALAHGADAAQPGWTAEWLVVAAIAASALAYARGALRLAARRATRPPPTPHDGAWFAGGLALLAATLLGPLDAWSGRSFAVHMVQHELIMLAAAPMLVLGRPLARWTWAVAPSARARLRGAVRTPGIRAAWGGVTGVTGACAVQTAALWAWHLPAWFRGALEHPAIHILQHATFLAVALCFWWSVLRPAAPRQAAARGIATLFITTLTTGALGALLTFGSTAWYALPGHEAPFGWTALEDQQLGGLIMWIPGGTAYVVVALMLGARALRPRRIAAARPLAVR